MEEINRVREEILQLQTFSKESKIQSMKARKEVTK
jgi:hypothetical protein